jgi:ABC-type bacteriocin/lantibiotic exporter with double-glycine peptidase domain
MRFLPVTDQTKSNPNTALEQTQSDDIASLTLPERLAKVLTVPFNEILPTVQGKEIKAPIGAKSADAFSKNESLPKLFGKLVIDLAATDPKLFTARFGVAVLSAFSWIALAKAGSTFTHALAVSDAVKGFPFTESFQAMGVGALAVIIKKSQDFLALEHDKNIQKYTFSKILNLVTGVPAHLIRDKKLSKALDDLKRHEFSLKELSKASFGMVQAALMATIAGIALATKNPLLTFICIGGPAILMLINQQRAAKRNQEAFDSTSLDQRQVNYGRQTAFKPQALEMLKSFGTVGKYVKGIADRASRIEDTKHKASKKNFYEGLLSTSMLEGAGLVGGGLYAALTMPFTQFLYTTFLIKAAQSAVTLFSDNTGVILEKLDAVKLFNGLADHIGTLKGEKVDVNLTAAPEIKIKNLSFTYPGKKNPALEVQDLTIPKGAKVYVCGPSGAGKTTLVKLIAGYLVPQEGSILVGDFDTRTNFVHCAIVPQDGEDFIGARFRDIIELGSTNESTRTFHDAAQLAGFDQILRDMGEKSQSDIPGSEHIHGGSFPHGTDLSGGQKQRLKIAMAAYSGAPLMFLDEPCAGLDIDATNAIKNTLNGFKGETTVIHVEHNASAGTDADLIIVVEEGKISDIGTHDELMRLGNNYYSHSYNEQKAQFI